MLCCSCNGRNAVCKWCTCQEAMYLLPSMNANRCVNTLPLRVDSVTESSTCSNAFPVPGNGSSVDHVSGGSTEDHMSFPAGSRYDFRVKSGSCANDDVLFLNPSDRQGLCSTGQELSCSSLDKLMNMVVNYYILALVIPCGVNAVQSSFSIWVSITHCVVVPLVKSI